MKDIFYESRKDKMNGIFAEEQTEYNGRLHFHRAFELAYVLDGKVRYIVEDEEFIAEAGDIVFCHSCYCHKSFDDFKHLKYIIAVPENLSKDISNLFATETLPSLLPDKIFNKSLLPYFEGFIRESQSMPKILSRGYANVLFGSLLQHYNIISVRPKNKSVSVVADILNYIDEHITEQITLEVLASIFGYNKTYFSRLFNKHVGMSLNNYLNMVRYNKFEMLHGETPDESVTKHVFECGFSSLATFYRVREFRNCLK